MLKDSPAFLTLPTTPSTMEAAAELVRAGRTDVLGVRALAQTAGRGRQGKTWYTLASPYGLAVTFLLPMAGPHMALLVALGVHRALVARWPGLQGALTLKWPNDLLLNGLKLGGILIETAKTPAGETWALAGFGLNLARPAVLPEGFPGTCVTQADTLLTETEIDALCTQFHTCIMQYVDIYRVHGWTAELHNSYAAVCSTLGQVITVHRGPAEPLTGLARGLTLNGHLELETQDGTVHVLTSGDVTLGTPPLLKDEAPRSLR